MDILRYHTLLVEVAVGHHAGGEEIVGDGVYNRAVAQTMFFIWIIPDLTRNTSPGIHMPTLA